MSLSNPSQHHVYSIGQNELKLKKFKEATKKFLEQTELSIATADIQKARAFETTVFHTTHSFSLSDSDQRTAY